MIIPDVNVLVHAFRVESAAHEPYRSWLTQTVLSAETIGLTALTASGFVRVVTHRRIFPEPAPTAQAMRFLAHLLAAPRVRWVDESASVWRHLQQLVDADPGIGANRVPDAYLAATALAHGARLATADRGFARYARLRYFDPCPVGAGGA